MPFLRLNYTPIGNVNDKDRRQTAIFRCLYICLPKRSQASVVPIESFRFLAWTRRFKLISQREGPLERCKVFGMEILNFISFPKKKSWYTNFWMHDQIKASAVETANRNKRESRFQGRIRNLTLYSLDSLDSLETATSKLKTQAIKTVFYVLPRCIDADRF